MAERAAGAGALLAVAVCCGLPALAGAAVSAGVASVVARSIVLGVIVLGLLIVAALSRVRRRSVSGCSGTAARPKERADVS